MCDFITVTPLCPLPFIFPQAIPPACQSFYMMTMATTTTVMMVTAMMMPAISETHAVSLFFSFFFLSFDHNNFLHDNNSYDGDDDDDYDNDYNHGYDYDYGYNYDAYHCQDSP